MSPLFRSFAKVNLHLQVVGRRPDGYHELRTLFQTIDLHDELEVDLVPPGGEGAGEVRLEVRDADLPDDARNLAWRAARAYLDRWGGDHGVALELRKRVPAGGGMGGGSANAATVLRALQELLGRPAPADELWSIARALGADVPFFLVGGTALGFGRGDEVLPVGELPSTRLVLAIPPVEVPTPRVFAALGEIAEAPLAPALLAAARGDRAVERALLAEGWNDLERAVLPGWDAVAAVYTSLTGSGAELVRLSGSGATVFAIFRDPPDLAALGARLPEGTRLEAATTLSRAEVAERWRASPGGSPWK